MGSRDNMYISSLLLLGKVESGYQALHKGWLQWSNANFHHYWDIECGFHKVRL